MQQSRLIGFLMAALTVGACGNPSFEVPDDPPHEKEEGGALHADLLDYPFLCGDPNNPREIRVPCPDSFPRVETELSCDSVGCHGIYDYTEATRSIRHLRGSDGPSCYTCHGKEWKTDTDKTVMKDDDD